MALPLRCLLLASRLFMTPWEKGTWEVQEIISLLSALLMFGDRIVLIIFNTKPSPSLHPGDVHVAFCL